MAIEAKIDVRRILEVYFSGKKTFSYEEEQVLGKKSISEKRKRLYVPVYDVIKEVFPGYSFQKCAHNTTKSTLIQLLKNFLKEQQFVIVSSYSWPEKRMAMARALGLLCWSEKRKDCDNERNEMRYVDAFAWTLLLPEKQVKEEVERYYEKMKYAPKFWTKENVLGHIAAQFVIPQKEVEKAYQNNIISHELLKTMSKETSNMASEKTVITKENNIDCDGKKQKKRIFDKLFEKCKE